MLGSILKNVLVTVALLLVTQTGTQCRTEIDFSLVTLPDWRRNSEYVTQCFNDRHNHQICDWNQRTEDGVVTVLESGPLRLEGKACLEFWYLSPAATNGSELRALLKSSVGLIEIWTSPALDTDAWRQVFVPLDIIEPGTQVVIKAVSMEGQFTFNQTGVRRGSCGPQCESGTELWTDESTRCLCPGGQLSCFPSQCPQGQICGPQIGRSSGISVSGTCTIHSHTDCSTFDGEVFRFMVPCTYTLAKTCSPSEAMPKFSVEVVNEQRNSSLPTVQQVIVEMGNFRVSLLKRQTRRVVVNGVWMKLPLNLGNGTINIKSNPAAVELASSFGLLVSYDNTGSVHLTLPSAYSDKVCGLCGNYNHVRIDDFRKPDGTIAQNATALATSWQSGPATSSCETILVPYQCDPQEMAEYSSELSCGGLLSSTGPFADCLSVLGAESYFRGCMVDMCSTHGDSAVLCGALQVYADICQEAGVSIPLWRNSTFCPLQCGENSHYNSCADGCPEVCSSLDIVGSCGSCEGRCECDSGLKLSGGKCVPAEDCGCWYNGKHYEKGATFSEGECEQMCQCMGNNDMQCITMQCADKEVCKVKDGVKGCFPFKPATCSVYGDPHYITFDGMAYDFQGGCSYTLTTTCGGESSVQFTVIGHNMDPALQNFTRSKLQAVALQVEDLYLTLNQSGEVYVNNSAVQLPYSNYGAYGSVWVYLEKNHIVLETTFGLRITIDGQNRLFLQVDERYKYELCGLCGTYSERQDDDFVAPGGQNATGPFEFGDSWKVPGNNECISHPNDPRSCDYDEENEAYIECYKLLGDAFKPCHEVIHPNIFLNNCVYDYCATSGDQHTLCESLKSYAAACQVAGVELPHWQTNTACADPQTTALPTHPTSTSPTTNQTICPINCDFEKNLCGWEQIVQDSFDWKRHSGPTPSSLTGPNQDHTTGAGFYMYIDGNSVTHGDSARLWSSMCHFNGPLCLHFWYHMYGSATAMALNIYLLKDNKATKLWVMMNNQGSEWHPGIVDIRVSGPFHIIIEGIRGSSALSDVAIDDISIHFGSCSGSFPGLIGGTKPPSTTAEVLPSHPICNIDCSFDSDLCSWNQMVTDAFDWTWQSGSTPTQMTGPSAAHTGDGHYLYIEASNVTHGDTARLISSECSASGPQCLQFWYHMYGSADTMGLHVYLFQNRLADAVWWKRNDQGNMWQLAQVDITTTGAFQIIFEGRRGSNEESDVAIDDVKLYYGQCSDVSGVVISPPTPEGNTTLPIVPVPTTAAPEPSVGNVTAQLPITAQSPAANITMPPTVEAQTNIINGGNVTEDPYRPPPHSVCQLNCNFEQDLCQWNQLLTDVFDWTRYSGSTPTMMTGPSSDHTTGDGHYIYIEANSASHGDTARLISSECSDSGPQCLQFWYHMYGSADTLGLNVYLLQDRKANAVWWKRNDQENMWHMAQVDLTTTGAFQIIFEGRRGSNDQSDVAIDDVSLHHGPCTVATVGPEFPSANTSTATQTQTSTSPEQPATSTNGPQTTARPYPPTTEHPEVATTEQPEPQTTARPEQPATSTNGPQTTARPYPPTTEHPGVATTEQPEPQTTARPEQPATSTNGPQTTARPYPPTTEHPGVATTEQPEPQTTARPEQPATSTNGPQTTARPYPPTTEHPGVATTEQPEPQTTARPEQPATSTNGPQTTARPYPPTTEHPGVATTEQPEPQTTARPEQPATSNEPPTTESQEATTGSHPPTTVKPQPSTEIQPEPQTTVKPLPPTTASPQPTTTAKTQPPTSHLPTPSCPENSHYTSCVPPCSPTCKHLNGPPGCSDNDGCEQGCVCDEGFVYKSKACVPIQQCGCVDRNGTGHHFNEVWYTNHCSQKCECEKDRGVGKIDCDNKDECDGNAVCLQNVEGNYYCQSTDFSECSIRGDPEYRTFDNMKHEFHGEHSYVLVRTNNLPNYLPQVYIEAINDDSQHHDDSSSEEHHNHSSEEHHNHSSEEHHNHGDSDEHHNHGDSEEHQNHGDSEEHHNHGDSEEHQNHGDSEEHHNHGDSEEHQNHGDSEEHQNHGDSEEHHNHGDSEEHQNHGESEEHQNHGDSEEHHNHGDREEHQNHGDSEEHQNHGDSEEHHNHGDSEEHHNHSVRDEDDEEDDDDHTYKHHHDSEEEHNEHYRLRELKIRVYDHTVVFKKDRRLIVDGRETNTPASPTAGLKIWEHSSRIYLKTDFGLSVEFDGRNRAEIILPHIYKRKVGGLCGNFDGRRSNDWMKPDGSRARRLQEFGESWRV